MKVLMLTPYLPYPLLSGGQIRTYNLLKQLSKKHDITLFCLIKDEAEEQYVAEVERYCHRVRVFRRSRHPFTFKNIVQTGFSRYPFLVIRNLVPSVVEAVRQELASARYDLIHAETFYMMPHLPATKIPIILVEQTIESLGYESYAKKAPLFLKPLLEIDIRKIRYTEQYYWRLADRLIVMSKEDKQLVVERLGQSEKIDVVANGVDTAWFAHRLKKLSKRPTALFVGTFKWLPNREAVDFLVKRVWPLIRRELPEAELHIVGNAPSAQVLAYQSSREQIRVTGNMPDIRTAFAQTDILIAPVFSGKGTRYKVLESMASGTPVVATPTAVEGLGLTPGKQVALGSTAEALAEAALRLLRQPTLRRQLAKEGREYVRRHYDWSLISTQLDQVYQKMGHLTALRD